LKRTAFIIHLELSNQQLDCLHVYSKVQHIDKKPSRDGVKGLYMVKGPEDCDKKAIPNEFFFIRDTHFLHFSNNVDEVLQVVIDKILKCVLDPLNMLQTIIVDLAKVQDI
jgi:hypothetical protein